MSSQGDRSDNKRDAGRHRSKIRSNQKVFTRQHHIAQIAQKYTDSPLTTLGHHMDALWMHEAFSRLKKQAAVGVDGVGVGDYAKDLESNLESLLERAKSGSYRAPPVKRKWIPKNEHEFRAIGIPTVEDKVLQRAVAMILEPIYETSFYEGSYGFRPKRSAHQACDQLREEIKKMDGGWVLDVDIQGFFDTLDHQILKEILRKRIQDKVILRLLSKWLKAGVLEDGTFHSSQGEGTPQGGVISPILSNIYLHEALDEWFVEEIVSRLKGTAKLIRYADDFVIVFAEEEDAHRVKRVLPKRLGKYGLTVHPEKTRLLNFRHPWKEKAKPETFEFLGFTFYWGKTEKNGYAVKKKTSAKKLRRSLVGIHSWCKANRHRPLKWQWKKLSEKLSGHYAYYGVYGNSNSIGEYRYRVERIWQHWLNLRSRDKGGMGWARFSILMRDHFPLPAAHIVHWPKTEHQLNWNL